ncbi:MAG: hypothetical protein AAGF97_13500 [Planctomycetota bacterium]
MNRIGVIFVLVATAHGGGVANDWMGGVDARWDTPANWSQGIVPLGAWQHPSFGWDDPACPCYPLTADPTDDGPLWNNDALLKADNATILIDDTTHATAYGVRIGFEGASNTLQMTGGRLDVGGIPPGETDRVGWHLDVGRGFNRSTNPNPVARFVMTGGVVDTNLIKVPEGFVDESLSDPYDTPGLHGEFIVSGGTMIARKLNIGQFTGSGSAELSGDAQIILWPSVASNRNNAGHFEMKQDWYINGQPVPTMADAYLDIRDDAVIQIFGNINEFTMTPSQAEVARYQQYVDDGWLTANHGTAAPEITLEPCPSDGSLDDYCLSGMMITISAPEIETRCDFDGDGVCDGNDVDALVAAIASGGNDPLDDLTGDGVVGLDDRDAWLTEAGAMNLPSGSPYLVGDANLDGVVDGQDFIAWNNSKFTAVAAWTGGDFNADGVVDGQDFIAWNTNKFLGADQLAVPEPISLTGLIVGCLWGWARLRRNAP